jgi:hypothetical protein
VGCSSAIGVLNRGWEVAEATDDGGQELRQSSGEGSQAEEGRRNNSAW